jgi:hypothetical protein
MTRQEVLEAVQAGTLSADEALDLFTPAAKPVKIKVTDEKKCLQVSGGRIRKFGATFYATEWRTILDHVDEIRQALEDYEDILAPDPQEQVGK